MSSRRKNKRKCKSNNDLHSFTSEYNSNKSKLNLNNSCTNIIRTMSTLEKIENPIEASVENSIGYKKEENNRNRLVRYICDRYETLTDIL